MTQMPPGPQRCSVAVILLACPRGERLLYALVIAQAAVANRPGTPAGRAGRDRARPARAARSVVVPARPGQATTAPLGGCTAPPQAAP